MSIFNINYTLCFCSGVSGEGCGVRVEGSSPVSEAVVTPPAADNKASLY